MKLISVSVMTLFFLTFSFGQIQISAYTDKMVYQYGESINITVLALNPTDTTITLTWYSNCKANYYIDDYTILEYWLSAQLCFDIIKITQDVFPHDSLVWDLQYPPPYKSPLSSGYHNVIGEVFGYGKSDTVVIEIIPAMYLNVRAKWNIVSVPLMVDDYSKTTLFPTASSNAFYFGGAYYSRDTLESGRGYWLKFDSAHTISLDGIEIGEDTIIVTAGWNMIGTISDTVTVSSVGSIPGGIITSNFFEFTDRYQSSTTLEPGKGYWVKVSQAGQLILSSSGNIPASNRIRIMDTGELPPVQTPRE